MVQLMQRLQKINCISNNDYRVTDINQVLYTCTHLPLNHYPLFQHVKTTVANLQMAIFSFETSTILRTIRGTFF